MEILIHISGCHISQIIGLVIYYVTIASETVGTYKTGIVFLTSE